MKRLAPLLILAAASCNSPDYLEIMATDGTRQRLVATPAMMGGRRTIYYAHRTADGGETLVAINQNNETSFDSAMMGLTAISASRQQARRSINRAEQVTKRRKIEADLAAQGLRQQTEQAEIDAGIIKAAIEKGIIKIPSLPRP
jgi:hypothetical protein